MKMENSRKDGCNYVHKSFEKISKNYENYGRSLLLIKKSAESIAGRQIKANHKERTMYLGNKHDDCDIMVDAGYAKRDEEPNQHGGYTYWLTRDGLDWLGKELGITIYNESD